MGKEGKMEQQSGLNLVITARDGIKKIDELEIPMSNLLIRCLSYEPIKAPISTSVKELEKQRRNFIEIKKFLEKYSR